VEISYQLSRVWCHGVELYVSLVAIFDSVRKVEGENRSQRERSHGDFVLDGT
jgi:hypothetical protein